jgi:hypothetical protein
MSDINHFAISSILGSEIVGRYQFGHGQIGSLGDAQRYFEALAVTESPATLHRGEKVDDKQVVKAFHAVRDARGDRGSPDLYVADPERNAASSKTPWREYRTTEASTFSTKPGNRSCFTPGQPNT